MAKGEPKKKIHELTSPEGEKLFGIELDFESLAENWNKYVLSDGSIVRVKYVLGKAYRVVDKDGNPLLNQRGDPEVFITGKLTVVSSESQED